MWYLLIFPLFLGTFFACLVPDPKSEFTDSVLIGTQSRSGIKNLVTWDGEKITYSDLESWEVSDFRGLELESTERSIEDRVICGRIIWLLAHPLPPSSLSNLSLLLSLPVCRQSSLLGGKRGQESLAFYKSFYKYSLAGKLLKDQSIIYLC